MAQRRDDTRYAYDLQHQRYFHASRANPATSQWEFVQWMPSGWQPGGPAPPAAAQLSRRDSSINLSSPAAVVGQAGSAYSASPVAGPAGSSMPLPTFYSTASPKNRAFPRGEGDLIEGRYNAELGSSHKNLHYEEIDPSYFVRSRDFFKEGKVFAIVLSEPAGANASAPTSYNSSLSVSAVRYQDNYVHTQTRRFVVVRAKRGFCYACPIFTYSNRATLKRGVRPEEHGIAYSYGEAPRLLPEETGIRKPPIAVAMATSVPNLHVASRIYYGIHHPIQYNVKVKDIGQVLQHHIPDLIGNWTAEDNGETKQAAEVTATADEPELLPHVEAEERDERGEQSRNISKKAGKQARHAPPSLLESKTGPRDPHAYDPEENVYGYDSRIAPHMYHPKYNPYGYHPRHNNHGYHPSSNPYSYHPEHNPFGYHPQHAPYCYHPIYSPHGYHPHANPEGYHPQSAPHNFHPKVNPYGYRKELGAYGSHRHAPDSQLESDDDDEDEEAEDIPEDSDSERDYDVPVVV